MVYSSAMAGMRDYGRCMHALAIVLSHLYKPSSDSHCAQMMIDLRLYMMAAQ